MPYQDDDHYYAQSELQRQQSESQQAMYAPQLAEQIQQAQAILVEQTNPTKIVNDIMLRLRGKTKLPNGNEVVVGKPKMNDKGIEAMWFILESHINQNVILSHLEPEEIGKIMMSLQDDLVDDLSLNWKTYGIQQKTDLDTINNSVLVNIFMALKRAEGQNEKNWLGKISIENISGGVHMPRAKRDSFWSKFRL